MPTRSTSRSSGKSGDVDYFTYTVPASAPEGTRITIRLSHLPKDFDLVVYGPQDALHSTAPNTPPLDGQAVGDTTPPLTHINDTLATQALNDVALKDALPAGVGVMGLSTQPREARRMPSPSSPAARRRPTRSR